MADAAQHILPSISTTFERSHVITGLEEKALIDAQEIHTQGDPTLCDVIHLPDLAYDTGSSFWNDAWNDVDTRHYVEDLWILKLLEGTPLGVEGYLNLVGARLIREILPPAQSFAMPDLGEVTHDQLLALMPQLRLYYHWPDKLFLDTVSFGDYACADRMFAFPDQGEALGRYPVLYDPLTNDETPLDVVSYDEIEQSVVLSHRGTIGSAFYADYACADLSSVGDPLVTAPIIYSTEDPDLETLKMSPDCPPWEFAAEHSTASYTYAIPDIGDVGTYDRLYLWDAMRVSSGHLSVATSAFYGDWSWLGMPAYHQILTVAVPGTPNELPYTGFMADTSYTLGDEQTSLFRAIQATATSKRGGDQIFLDLAPTFAGTRPAVLPAITDISQ